MNQDNEKRRSSIVRHRGSILTGLVFSKMDAVSQSDLEMHYSTISDDVTGVGKDGLVVSYQGISHDKVRRHDPADRDKASDRITAHCELLDGLNVPNGSKAIAIALHENWSDCLRIKFGEVANAATVKKWRTARARLAKVGHLSPPATGRRSGPERVVRGLRRHHAILVTASGGRMRDAYRRAIAEVQVVNEAGRRFYGKPNSPLPLFGYEAFRRECLSIRHGGRAQPTPRRRR